MWARFIGSCVIDSAAPFPRQTLLRIHERSGGNPFFALEIARVLPRTSNRFGRFRSRRRSTSSCGRGSRRFRRARGRPSRSRPPSARRRSRCSSRRESPRSRSSPHSRPGSSNVTARSIRFTHPLLSSVLYGGLGPERRRIHARIAEIADDPIVRARHLALGTDAPDAAVARVLDEAAALAEERGAGRYIGARGAGAPTDAALTARRTPRAGVGGRARPPCGRRVDARTVDRRRPARRGRRGRASRRGPPAARRFRARRPGRPRARGGARPRSVGSSAPGTDCDPPRLGPALQEWIRRCARARRAPRSSSPTASATTPALPGALQRHHARDFVGDPEALSAVTAHASSRLRAATCACSVTPSSSTPAGSSPPATRRRAREARARVPGVARRDELFAASLIWDLSWIELWAGRWAIASDYAERAREIRLQYGVDQNQATSRSRGSPRTEATSTGGARRSTR